MTPSGSLTRITKTTERMPNLSPERRAVEDCMRRTGGTLTPERIAEITGIERTDVVVILNRMRRDGQAVCHGRQLWRLSVENMQGARGPICNASTTERYDGAELRPFDRRPGAMDFKQWPSKGLG